MMAATECARRGFADASGGNARRRSRAFCRGGRAVSKKRARSHRVFVYLGPSEEEGWARVSQSQELGLIGRIDWLVGGRFGRGGSGGEDWRDGGGGEGRGEWWRLNGAPELGQRREPLSFAARPTAALQPDRNESGRGRWSRWSAPSVWALTWRRATATRCRRRRRGRRRRQLWHGLTATVN